MGVTPEAPDLPTALAAHDSAEGRGADTVALSTEQLAAAWRALDSGAGEGEDSVELVAVGNPHLSLQEVRLLAEMVGGDGDSKHPGVSMVATMGRQVMAEAEAEGCVQVLQQWGVEFVTDTCWCMLGDVVPYPPIVNARTLITNSGKYAHYAPGLVNRTVRYSSLGGCITAARTGRAPPPPRWLSQRTFATMTRVLRLL